MEQRIPQPNIELRIEQLALEGLKVPQNQRPQLQAALSAELSRLVATHGIPARLQTGPLPRLQINFTSGQLASDPSQLGQQIAQSIYGNLYNEKISNPPA